MKKILLASTVLAMTASVAAADVTLSGYGRFGLDYNENNRDRLGVIIPNDSSTQVSMRMRLNIDANMETDGGVAFGGRIRLQYDDGDEGTEVAPAQLYVTYSGLRVEVGNVDTAIDSVALIYNSEIGYIRRSFGNPVGNFYAFESGPYDDDDRMGIAAAYSISGVNLRISYVDHDQTTNSTFTTKGELGIAADYNFGQITVAAAYTDNVGGIDGDDVWFIGAEYAVSEVFSVGLLHNSLDSSLDGDRNRTTLYGSYTMDAITVRGYVARDNYNGIAASAAVPPRPAIVAAAGNRTDTAFGLGVDYDLGGAFLSGDVHRNYDKDTVAGLGVRFDF